MLHALFFYYQFAWNGIKCRAAETQNSLLLHLIGSSPHLASSIEIIVEILLLYFSFMCSLDKAYSFYYYYYYFFLLFTFMSCEITEHTVVVQNLYSWFIAPWLCILCLFGAYRLAFDYFYVFGNVYSTCIRSSSSVYLVWNKYRDLKMHNIFKLLTIYLLSKLCQQFFLQFIFLFRNVLAFFFFLTEGCRIHTLIGNCTLAWCALPLPSRAALLLYSFYFTLLEMWIQLFSIILPPLPGSA